MAWRERKLGVGVRLFRGLDFERIDYQPVYIPRLLVMALVVAFGALWLLALQFGPWIFALHLILLFVPVGLYQEFRHSLALTSSQLTDELRLFGWSIRRRKYTLDRVTDVAVIDRWWWASSVQLTLADGRRSEVFRSNQEVAEAVCAWLEEAASSKAKLADGEELIPADLQSMRTRRAVEAEHRPEGPVDRVR
jgi:hypothetical protein